MIILRARAASAGSLDVDCSCKYSAYVQYMHTTRGDAHMMQIARGIDIVRVKGGEGSEDTATSDPSISSSSSSEFNRTLT
jgi:hypothetical protein